MKNIKIEENLKQLAKEFPCIHFSEYGSMWIRLDNGMDREGLGVKFNPENPDREVITVLNEVAKKVVLNPSKYFWCTNCNMVKETKEDWEASVFAGHYCKKCASEDKELMDLIKESKKPGFYE